MYVTPILLRDRVGAMRVLALSLSLLSLSLSVSPSLTLFLLVVDSRVIRNRKKGVVHSWVINVVAERREKCREEVEFAENILEHGRLH